MGLARTFRRKGLPLTLAVAAAIAYGVFAVTDCIARRNTMALPGAVISLLAYGTLGYFTLRGRAWARWVMFALVLLTALTCMFFALFSLGSGKPAFDFSHGLAGVSVFFALIAVSMALPRPRLTD